MTIQKTNDYKIFKTLKGNRSLFERHVNRLIESIDQENLLAANPIIVNAKMQVIDGQHRLEAAKRLGVPIYYVIDETPNISTVRRLNTYTKLWGLNNYVDSFATMGNGEYETLKLFLEVHNLAVAVALSMFHPEGRMGEVSKAMKEGKFTAANLGQAEGLARMGKAILPYSKPSIWSSREFFRALFKMNNVKDFSWKRFLEKCELVYDRLGGEPIFERHNKSVEYLRDFERVYNFKVRDSFRIRFF